MRRMNGWFLTLFLIPGFQSAFASSDAVTTGLWLGDDLVIAQDYGDELNPAIAYNSVHDEYLVVWQDAYDVVKARRVLSDGTLQSEFVVAESSNAKRQPAVAYDRTRDRYLVTFVHDYYGNGTDFDIYGRFIPWNGPDASFHDFSIGPWSSNQGHPAVAYAEGQDEFLVVWVTEASGVPKYIEGRRIFANGSGTPGMPFTISSGVDERDSPDIAYNRARNEYLVAWDIDVPDADIRAARLSGSGGLIEEILVADYIGAWEVRPAVAACSASDQYLVAWESDDLTGGSEWAAYARYVAGDGTKGSIYLVDGSATLAQEVDLDCDPAGLQYLLGWQAGGGGVSEGVRSRIAYPEATWESWFWIQPPGDGYDRTAAVVGAGRGQFLVAWEHQTGFIINRDIYALLVFPTRIFRDGFQSGGTGRWTTTAP